MFGVVNQKAEAMVQKVINIDIKSDERETQHAYPNGEDEKVQPQRFLVCQGSEKPDCSGQKNNGNKYMIEVPKRIVLKSSLRRDL